MATPFRVVNQKGVVERDLTRKESYYVFQSYWTEMPMVHIYGHSWPVRWGKAGEKRNMQVYSNCDSAELFLNGVSMGVKRRDSQDFPSRGTAVGRYIRQRKKHVARGCDQGRGKDQR
jgi:beta-galactosidase